VIQTDMQLERDRCGGPVVDLDGNVVGISIARADRTRSFVLPAAHILKVLGSDPLSEDAARAAMSAKEDDRQQVARNEEDAGPRQQQQPQVIPLKPGSADRLRRHLEDMDRLMERMKEEMEGMEE
jgi:S1-C subfamily serine protease